MTNQSILVICGPTASGKTALALNIANELLLRSRPPSHVNILSVDSRQIYTGLDIVTGKDIPANLPPQVHIFGLNLVQPGQSFAVVDFVDYAHKIIDQSQKDRSPLIIVGGTGLYLKAIISNYLNIRIPPNPELRRSLDNLTLEQLHETLFQVNRDKLQTMNNSDLHNRRRLIRAIEVSAATRNQPTVSSSIPTLPTRDFHIIGLHQDKKDLAQKIRQRVVDRLNAGAIDEVRSVLTSYSPSSLIFTSLGVKPIIAFLHGQLSRDELLDRWTASEIDYARRQMVWFKKQPHIVWYDKHNIDHTLIAKLATKIS